MDVRGTNLLADKKGGMLVIKRSIPISDQIIIKPLKHRSLEIRISIKTITHVKRTESLNTILTLGSNIEYEVEEYFENHI